jgi:hypothetical protein
LMRCEGVRGRSKIEKRKRGKNTEVGLEPEQLLESSPVFRARRESYPEPLSPNLFATEFQSLDLFRDGVRLGTQGQMLAGSRKERQIISCHLTKRKVKVTIRSTHAFDLGPRQR